ncbi:MAG TPA: cytochrome c3 family protein [Flavobacterium sp.]|nr:cytochrome c3 family protein [Flavobacterium sp.]
MRKINIFAVITIVILTLVMVFPHEMVSPGELYQAHNELQNDCLACHKPFAGTPNENCISCHKINEIDKKNTVQFHQKMQNQSCITCHSDHKGLNIKLALNKFEHRLLNENDRNACVSCHAQPKNQLHNQVTTSCVSCHTTTNWKTIANFNHDLVNAKSRNNCVSCHQVPKDNFHNKTSNNCLSCHSLTKWKPSTFNHDKYFILDKDHNTNCATCHQTTDFKTYTCYGCHEHTLSNIRSEHLEEGISNFTNCTKCHKSANKHDIQTDGKEALNYITKDSNKKERENDDH